MENLEKIFSEVSEISQNSEFSTSRHPSSALVVCRMVGEDGTGEFRIPQRGRQRQLQNLFLYFPPEKLTAKAYHKRLMR